MPRRIESLTNGNYYHLYNRTLLSDAIISPTGRGAVYFTMSLDYYRYSGANLSLSQYLKLNQGNQLQYKQKYLRSKTLVTMVAYCLMSNHFHALVHQDIDNGIVQWMGNTCNSYVKYYNKKHERKGPLFESRFKVVPIESNEQLLQACRYIHLNPVTAGIIPPNQLENYKWSSLPNCLNTQPRLVEDICDPSIILDQFATPQDYHQFVLDGLL